MLRLKTTINSDDIISLTSTKNGTEYPLNPISRIDIVIQSLGVVISDSSPTSYPIKWIHDPVEDGVVKMQLGNNQDLIDRFIIEGTGSILTGSNVITGLSDDIMSKLENGMIIEGILTTKLPQILNVRKPTNEVVISDKAISDISNGALGFIDHKRSRIYKAEIYIFNIEYPNGLYWGTIELDIRI